MVLHEVPGASERPAHCAILIQRESPIPGDGGDGTTTVDIPPIKLGNHVVFTAVVFSCALLLLFVTGAVLYTTGKPILLLDMIAGNGAQHGLSPPLKRYIGYSVPLWLALLWLGLVSLASVIRPAFHRERLKFDSSGVEYEKTDFRRKTLKHISSDSVRVFTLQQEDHEGALVTLVLEGRGESITLGEYLRPLEREWLASVGNALLRNLSG